MKDNVQKISVALFATALTFLTTPASAAVNTWLDGASSWQRQRLPFPRRRRLNPRPTFAGACQPDIVGT